MSHHKSGESGFSLVEMLMVVAIIAIIMSIGIPNLMAAKRRSNEASAISNVRSLVTAQSIYRNSYGAGQFAPDLAALASASIVDSSLGAGLKTGYHYTSGRLTPTPTTTERHDTTAYPIRFDGLGPTGRMSIYSNETGVIYWAESATAPTADPETRAVTDGQVLNNN